MHRQDEGAPSLPHAWISSFQVRGHNPRKGHPLRRESIVGGGIRDSQHDRGDACRWQEGHRQKGLGSTDPDNCREVLSPSAIREK